MTHARAIEAIDRWASAPHAGLPEEVFLLVSRLVPMVNVDLLIQAHDESGRTLLTWRDDMLYAPPGWHVPGGMIRFKERAEDRVREVARLELGATVAFDPVPIAVNEVIHPEPRRNRGHSVSLLFRCVLTSLPADVLRFDAHAGAPRSGQWAWHERCPHNLIAVHEMYRRFIAP